MLSGISVGLESAVYSAVLIGAAVYGAYLLGMGTVLVSLFAVAIAGTGLLTTVGVIVSMDTFGPVSDNAQGIAEMSGDIDEKGARVLTDLDAVGNTTKAITKGIAIATAVLAATALFGSFTETVLQTEVGQRSQRRRVHPDPGLDIAYPDALVGLILGAAVVFLFSGLAISAVSRAAGRVVFEVREQFRTKPGIMDGTERPDYGRVVDICTRDSLRELITPGTLAVLAPIAVGFGLGYAPARRATWAAPSPAVCSWRCSCPTPVAPGTTPRRWSRTAPTAVRVRTSTPRRSSATRSVTRSRTPPARPSTR